ncbi:MAG: hypothetical protein LBC74_12720 [Planctomycetaceae bacterium]|jgi:biopolymer transport protein ExbB/TolQ|nr:hypothetical protein [Planctomycetaceae bacterium]
MATLMGLFQTVANIKNTLDNLGDVSSMISDVADKIEKATPSVKAFNSAFDILKVGIDSVADAKKEIEYWKIYEPDQGDFQVWQEWAKQLQVYKNELSTVEHETEKIFSNTKIFDSLVKNAFEAANSLKNLPASTKNLQADYELLRKMNEIKQNPEMQKNHSGLGTIRSRNQGNRRRFY